MAKHKRKRDWQKRKVYRLGWELPHGETYQSITDAQQDLQRMYVEMANYLAITDPRIACVPDLLRPAPQRTHHSIYSPRRHCIICAVGKLYQRKLIHEMCHALNYKWEGRYRRTVGASHGYRYTSIYIFALGIYMFNGDFDHVLRIANKHGCKYDAETFQHLKQQYQAR